MEHLQLKDHGNEFRIVTMRVVLMGLFVMLMMGLLLGRYYNLQVTHYHDYVTQSDRNRIHVQPIRPTRGLIYDRNGILLAENRPNYALSIIKERVNNMEETLAELAEIIDISEGDRDRFFTGLDQRRRPYDPVSLRFNLTETEIARLAVNEYRLAGVSVEAQLVRHYPFGELFTHSVGYVGRINERELQSFTEGEYQNYRGTDTIGKLGLEHQYEELLLGQVGFQNVETDARGRVLEELERKNPVPGRDLHLHMDIEVQKAAFDALGDTRGALVAIDVETGGIVALVSTPSYDANLFVTGISTKDFNALNQSLDSPFLNRALQGKYPPGSTVKPMLGLAGLHFGVVNELHAIRDRGVYQLEGEERIRRDWKKGGHGTHVDLHQAVVESCNIYFYDLAYRLTIDRIYNFGRQFGLGEKTGIDIPNENRGLWPSRVWKKAAKGLPWYPGDTLNVGIGQGDVSLTPLQLALMTSTLASRGHLVVPQIVDHQSSSTQLVVPDRSSETDDPAQVVDLSLVTTRHWDYVLGAMADVVGSIRGTAKKIRSEEYTIAGKTGTAQLVEIAQDEDEIKDDEPLDERLRNQALFISYAPTEKPKLAVAVIIENGEHGSASAPVARAVFDAYFASEKRRAEQAEQQKITRNDEVQTPVGFRQQIQAGSSAN